MANSTIHKNTKAAHALSDALLALDRLDSDFEEARAKWGSPPDRFQTAGFPALVRIILGQQISRAVAQTLWTRLSERDWQSAQTLARLDYADLQAVGLSRRKSEYIIDLARAEADGRLALSELAEQPADIFSKTLMAYRGVGGWTVSNYRLFCLADLDAWPGNDLALMEAVKRLKNLPSRPSHAEMDNFALLWQPYRGAAALMLWHLYACLVRDNRPMG